MQHSQKYSMLKREITDPLPTTPTEKRYPLPLSPPPLSPFFASLPIMIALLSLSPLLFLPLKKANFSLLLPIRNPGRRHKSFLPPSLCIEGGERAILVPGKKGGGDDSNIWEKERRGGWKRFDHGVWRRWVVGMVGGGGGRRRHSTDSGILVGGAFFERCVCCTERLGRQRKNDGRKKNNLPAIHPPSFYKLSKAQKVLLCFWTGMLVHLTSPSPPQKKIPAAPISPDEKSRLWEITFFRCRCEISRRQKAGNGLQKTKRPRWKL